MDLEIGKYTLDEKYLNMSQAFKSQVLELAEFCLVKGFPFQVAKANAGMSQCNDCTRGEYAEEGVDDGGRAGKTATKHTKTYKSITCYAILCNDA